MFLVGIVAIGLTLGRLVLRTNKNGASLSGFPVYLNEIMSSNNGYYDERGNAYDWIELYNSSDMEIRLSQYKLTDNERKVRYIFPNDARIPAKGYHVIWCKSNAANQEYADFSISKAGGETIVLMNSRSVIVDRVVTLPLEANTAMARDAGGFWTTLSYGTPAFENTQAGYQAYQSARRADSCPIRFNEIMSANQSYLDENRRSSDWIELYNDSDDTVDLSGFRISDRSDADGYVFADGTRLAGRQYLVLRCDGAAANVNCAPFSLSALGGETITLSSGDTVLDSVITAPAQADTSLTRDASGAWQTSQTPTPGFENSEEGYARYLASVTQQNEDVRITELMASNLSCIQDAAGAFSDWIELTNFGSGTVQLGGYYLSDRQDRPRKWLLPELELPPGARAVIFASGKDGVVGGELHAPFSLNRHQGIVTLCAANGQIISSASYGELGDNVSLYANERTGEWSTTARATPGHTNDEGGYEAFQSEREPSATLGIHEAMTGNASLLEQKGGLFFDWIELKNQSSEAIDLSRYTLTDNLEKPSRCALPSKTLAPGALLVLLCTGDTPLLRPSHDQIALSLDAIAEQLYLLDENGAVADSITLEGIPYGASCGRLPDRNGQFYFSVPTPGAENEGGYRMISEQPTASVAPGVYRDVASLTVSFFSEGDIYYTTNGNTPTEGAMRYTGPITIQKTTVLRACAVSAGRMMSRPVTLNYFLNVEHTLPIIAVATETQTSTTAESESSRMEICSTARWCVRPTSLFFRTKGAFAPNAA